MSSLRLSIIIPTLNEASVIRAAVERAWRLNPCEVIVSDGGSRDGTTGLANDAGAVVVTGSAGRGLQLNAGAAVATGDLLLFLHADTWLDPAAATQLADALAESRIQWGAFRQRIDATGWRYRALEAGNAWRARRWRTPYGDQAMFVCRSVFDRVGKFPEQPIMEDVDLSRRLRRLSPPELLSGPVHISARRWKRNGVVRQTVQNWTLLALWRLGFSPTTLLRWYRPHSPLVNTQPAETDSKEELPALEVTR